MTVGAPRAWHPRRLARLAVPAALILLLAGLDKQPTVRALLRAWQQPAHYGALLLDLLLAIYLVHTLLDMVRLLLAERLGPHHARTAAKFVGAVLYAVVGALTVTAAGFNLSGLFVGGALTGVVLGMAAQASLANVVAGVVLLFVRPYAPGSRVSLMLNSTEYHGRVLEIGLAYTTLRSEHAIVRVPNGTMVAAVLVLPEEEAT